MYSVGLKSEAAMATANVSVAIIGAGASGLAAAATLFIAGLESVVVLEASNRIGGRINR